MSRKSIYDIIEESKFNSSLEYTRLRYRFDHEHIEQLSGLYCNSTIYERVKNDLFNNLPIKGTCIDLRDLLKELKIDLSEQNANLDDLFNLIEFILCVIDADYSCMRFLYDDIMSNIDIVLEKTSHKIIKGRLGRIVVPANEIVDEAVALVDDKNISLEILEYNHRSNIGNLTSKQTILAKIGKAYELKIKKSNNPISDDISFLLNKLNIRHNNSVLKDKQIMDNIKDDLEEWYDKLYTLLVAFIIYDETEKISKEVQKLKRLSKKDSLPS